MTRIGLVADTHVPEAGDDLPPQAYEALRGCDAILHCGDLHTLDVVDRLERIAPTVVSRGNGDTLTPRVRRPGVPEDPRVVMHHVREVHGWRIGLSHDLAHVEGRAEEDVPRLLARRFGEPVHIAVSGHSHVPMLWGLSDGTLLVNPGSPTMPYGYLGLMGTLGVLDLDDTGYSVALMDLSTGSPLMKHRGPAPYPLTFGPRPAHG